MSATFDSHATAAHALACRQLTCVRAGKRVLNKVSMQLHPGEMLGILGANGAGKSTLLATLAGELAVDPALHLHCPVLMNGREMVHMSAGELARLRAVLPQKAELAFDLAVNEVVSMGLYPFPELESAACRQLLNHAAATADIEALWERRYPELSGGEQQRVQFARVMAQTLAASRVNGAGCYLLLDEPSSSLDPAHQHVLLKAARTMARAGRVGVVVVLHDVNLAAVYCDRLALMAQGGILVSGSPTDVLQSELLEQVYGAAVHVQAHPVHAGIPLVVFL